MRPSTSPPRYRRLPRAENLFPLQSPRNRRRDNHNFSRDCVSTNPRGGSGTQHPVATMATGQFEMEPGEIDPYGYVIAAIGFACFTHFYGSIKVRYHTHHSR